MYRISTFLVISLIACTNGQTTVISEETMQSLLAEYNELAVVTCNRVAEARWNVATDVGNKTKEDEKV